MPRQAHFENSPAEAGLQVDADINDPIIVEARTALASWRDPQEGLARKLDQTLLNDLVSEGYVLTESKLRQRRRDSERVAKAARLAGTPRRQLFGRKVISVPPLPAAQTVPASVGANSICRVFFIRVRRRSDAARLTHASF